MWGRCSLDVQFPAGNGDFPAGGGSGLFEKEFCISRAI